MNLNKKTNAIIISHFSFKYDEKSDVFPQNIRDFLLERTGYLAYIDHPFPDSDFPASDIRIYSHGKKEFYMSSPKIKLPILILYSYQFFLTLFFLIRKPMRYDLCIACDNLSLISVYLLRKIGVIKKIVYYHVDYTPERYSNPFLNNLYHFLDRIASKISDVNWVVVENMIDAKAKNGLDVKKSAPFQIVPIGYSRGDIFVKPVEEVDRFHLVYVGLLFEKQGLQLVIKSLPKIIKKFPKVHLTVVGDGPYKSALKKLVTQLNIASRVTFFGFMRNQREISKFLANHAGVGLATYSPSIGGYTFNGDPSKIKLYLSCGIPIITTKVPPIAEIIARNKAGFAINYSEDDFIDSLELLIANRETYRVYRENALIMSGAYDIKKFLDDGFKALQ